MTFALLLAVIFPAPAAAYDIYSYRYGGKEIHARVGQVGGVKVNDLCETAPKKCEALKAYHGKSKFKSLKGVTQGNFVGKYCELLGGTQLFAAQEKEQPIPFCVFKDLTFIEAQALYEKHSGVKK